MTVDHRSVFTPQYAKSSGPGSTLEASKPYRDFVSSFIVRHDVESVVDLACGDGVVGTAIELHGATYLGVDVIGSRIDTNIRRYPSHRWDVRDICTQEIPEADLLLCKDVLQHWSNADVTAWLTRLSTVHFRFALLTNDHYGANVNLDITTGGWRALDLLAPPFCVDGEVVFTYECRRGPHVDTKEVVLISGSDA